MGLAGVSDASRRTLLGSVGAALFILGLGALDALTRGAIDLPSLVPPFGASTVIVFFAPGSPASRSWNLIVGHLGSALVALAALWLLPAAPVALVGAVAVAGAGVWMAVSRSIHPPGGATALLAVLSGRELGHGAPLLPLLAGCVLIVGVRRLLDGAIQLSRARTPSLAGEVELGER